MNPQQQRQAAARLPVVAEWGDCDACGTGPHELGNGLCGWCWDGHVSGQVPTLEEREARG